MLLAIILMAVYRMAGITIMRPEIGLECNWTNRSARGERQVVASTQRSLGIIITMAEPTHTPPDEDESTYYYKYMASRPRLVARTSLKPWDAGKDSNKRFYLYHRHAIVPIWNSGGLLEAVVHYIQSTGIAWHAPSWDHVAGKVGEESVSHALQAPVPVLEN
jgi:hypothetical protein